MPSQVFMAFICVFSIIGLISVLYAIIDAFTPKDEIYANTVITVFAKDQEDTIEGDIHTILKNIRQTPLENCKIHAIDLSSVDDTAKILKALSDDYSGISFFSRDEYLNFLKDI